MLHGIGLVLSITCTAQITKKDLTEYYIKTSEICGGMDSILSRKGSWKKLGDDLAFPDKSFPRSQYKQVNIRADNMLSLFKEGLPDLSGFEPSWYRSIRGESWIPNGPVPYAFTSLYFGYYCNTNYKKIMIEGETGTWVYVFTNSFGWFFDKVGDWDIKGDGKKIAVFCLPPKAGAWKEKTLYAPRTHGPNVRAVILGHDNKVPWRSLTQKEYLQGLKAYWLEEKNKTANSIKTGIQKLMDAKPPSTLSPEQQVKIRKGWDEQIKRSKEQLENINSPEMSFNKEIRNIEDYLATVSSQTLEQLAFVNGLNPGAFKGKFADEKNGGTRVVAVSSKYFKDLPRYVPQFMILYWRWTDDPVSLIFKKQFEEDFPLERLTALIDK